MKLFTLSEQFTIELNKEWILMVPEFSVLVRRDKGSEGDYRGDKKLKAIKELTFIYFDLDFSSPLRDWDEFERREEAMKYAGLMEADMDDKVMAAHAKYHELLHRSSPSLAMLEDMKFSLKQLRNYFKSVDLTKENSRGELVYTMPQYLAAIKGVQPAFDFIEMFEKRVGEELKGEDSIRGTAALGRKEGAKREWAEGQDDKPTVEKRAGEMSFADIASLLGDGEDSE